MGPELVAGWSAALYGIRLARDEAARIAAAADAQARLIVTQSAAARAYHGPDVFFVTPPRAAEATLRAALEARVDG